MNPSPSPSGPFDLLAWLASAALGSMLLWLLVSAVLAVLGLLATYWLIRLAVRHGTMDTARWQAAGMSDRGLKHSHAMPVQTVAPATQSPARPAPRGSSRSDVPVPPRDTLQW